MDKFEGFPAGELRYISVPDLLFADLVPRIDNLAELKTVLHLIWLRQRFDRQAVTLADLLADETLARGLAVGGADPESALTLALDQAVKRGALLKRILETETGVVEVFALNSEGGRRALADIEAGKLGIQGVVLVEKPPVEPRANIFELYEDNIGLLSPILADELREAEATYPADWIEEAFHIAVSNNVRKWRYIQAILERWTTEGRGDGTDQRDTEKGDRWYTDEEFKQFFVH